MRDEAQDTRYYEERIIIGPCICQGCHQEVVGTAGHRGWLGWLHENGSLRCPKPGPKVRK